MHARRLVCTRLLLARACSVMKHVSTTIITPLHSRNGSAACKHATAELCRQNFGGAACDQSSRTWCSTAPSCTAQRWQRSGQHGQRYFLPSPLFFSPSFSFQSTPQNHTSRQDACCCCRSPGARMGCGEAGKQQAASPRCSSSSTQRAASLLSLIPAGSDVCDKVHTRPTQ